MTLKRFEEQLESVYPEAVRFARGLAGSETDGDDLLQDALVRALKGYPRLRDPARFKHWLLRIIRNAHRDSCRKNAVRRWLSLDTAGEIPAPRGIPFEEKAAVRQALQKIPRLQREAIVLFEVLGMSIDEIAGIQNATVPAGKSRLSRGRERLRAAYEGLSREEEHHGVRFVEAD